MKLKILNYCQIILVSLFCLSTKTTISHAQVTSDVTVDTQVNQNGNTAEITGGATRGDNLFHSFQDFSVGMGNEAFFNNADSIANIFSRVTGGNISNIDGLIRANGSANLFLINPVGILFGEGAGLSLGGSFYGSTADSILFQDGEFSATDLDNPPILTVNAPIGFSFRDNPGDISTDQSELIVNNGQSIFLLGGNLNFVGGVLGALDGRVELGGLTESGTVNINNNGSLDFPEAVARGDISLANSARIFVAGDEGGSIEINARNLSITSGSFLAAGINVDSGFPDAQAGDIVINLTEDLVIDGLDSESPININNQNFGTGNGGNVEVDARNVTFSNGGNIAIFNSGTGNIGDVTITATEDISFDGASDIAQSGIANFFDEQTTGSIGNINLTAQNFNLTNGGSISSQVSENSDSGNINLNIADTIRVDGFVSLTGSDETLTTALPSSIVSRVGGNGNSGNINIETQNLSLSKQGLISTVNSGQGNAGDININVDSLSVTEGGRIDGTISGMGNGGNILINASDNISIDGDRSDLNTAIFADINPGGVGEAGNIEINTARLSVDNAFISADVSGDGNGGNITISTTDSIELSNSGLIQADVLQGGRGNGGNLNIETEQLTLNDRSQITADIFEGALGNGGNLNLDSNQIILNNAFISSNVLGDGNGGNIIISTTDSIELSNNSLIQAAVNQGSIGNGGNLNLETEQLTLNDGSLIGATTFGIGNAGTVTIRANDSINLSGITEFSRGGIFASALEGNGNGGNVDIFTDQLTISDGAIISASNFSSRGVAGGGSAPGTGEPGNIRIVANSLRLENEGRIEARTQAETGDGANIDLEIVESIFLMGSSFISAEAVNNANGGNINIDTNNIVAFPDGNNDIIASAAQGQGGNIDITAEFILGIQERPLSLDTNDINASSEFGLDGNISISTPDINTLQSLTELPRNVVDPQQLTAQACSDNRETAATNSFAISGKGGILPAPDQPLNSANISIDGQNNNATSNSPQQILISKGKITPARGVEITEEGKIILTAYRTTNNSRIPAKTNCSSSVSRNAPI